MSPSRYGGGTKGRGRGHRSFPQKGGSMKRRLSAVVLVGIVSVLGTAPAFAAEKHPPKFGVNDTQCASGSNQPQCPGVH